MKKDVEGITLNQQLVDLLSIIDDYKDKTEQNKKIEEYISTLRGRIERLNHTLQTRDRNITEESAKYKFIISEVIDNSTIIPELKKEELKIYYMKNASDLKICDRNYILKDLQQLGFDHKLSKMINDDILTNIKTTDFSAKPGILEMTPHDVRNLYNHMFDEKQNCRYNRITMDTCRKIFRFCFN